MDFNQFWCESIYLVYALFIMFISCYFWIIYGHMKWTLNAFFMFLFSTLFATLCIVENYCISLILLVFLLCVVINVWCFFKCVYWVSHLCYVENLFIGFLPKERHTWKCNCYLHNCMWNIVWISNVYYPAMHIA